MVELRPNVVVFGGFDPSAGAGVLADVKTVEQTGAYAMSVCTALTYQNDTEFDACDWIGIEKVIGQYKVLSRRFRFVAAKIGLVQDLSVVQEIVSYLKKDNPSIDIVWDPVLSASAGYRFNNLSNADDFNVLCKEITLLTPNIIEAKSLFGEFDFENVIFEMSNKLSLLLKGGHAVEKGRDVLFENRKKTFINTDRGELMSKHGSGCVLSSAICSYLGQGYGLLESCKMGKDYVEQILSSNNTLLAYHRKSEI